MGTREKNRDYISPNSLASSSVRGTESLIWPSIPLNSTHPFIVNTKAHFPSRIGEMSMILPSSNLENKVSLGNDIMTLFCRDYLSPSSSTSSSVKGTESLIWPSIPSNFTHPKGVSTKGHSPLSMGLKSKILPSSNLEKSWEILGNGILKTPFNKSIEKNRIFVNRVTGVNRTKYNRKKENNILEENGIINGDYFGKAAFEKGS